jgi:hypothetical protein
VDISSCSAWSTWITLDLPSYNQIKSGQKFVNSSSERARRTTTGPSPSLIQLDPCASAHAAVVDGRACAEPGPRLVYATTHTSPGTAAPLHYWHARKTGFNLDVRFVRLSATVQRRLVAGRAGENRASA